MPIFPATLMEGVFFTCMLAIKRFSPNSPNAKFTHAAATVGQHNDAGREMMHSKPSTKSYLGCEVPQ